MPTTVTRRDAGRFRSAAGAQVRPFPAHPDEGCHFHCSAAVPSSGRSASRIEASSMESGTGSSLPSAMRRMVLRNWAAVRSCIRAQDLPGWPRFAQILLDRTTPSGRTRLRVPDTTRGENGGCLGHRGRWHDACARSWTGGRTQSLRGPAAGTRDRRRGRWPLAADQHHLPRTGLGPFPIDMIGAGEKVGNTTPPSVALLAYAAAQVGLVLAAAPAVSRLLAHPRWWRPVIRLNPRGHAGLPVAHGAGGHCGGRLLPDWGDAPADHRISSAVGAAPGLDRPAGRRPDPAHRRPAVGTPAPAARSATGLGPGRPWSPAVLVAGLAAAGFGLTRLAIGGFAPGGWPPPITLPGYACSLLLTLLSGPPLPGTAPWLQEPRTVRQRVGPGVDTGPDPATPAAKAKSAIAAKWPGPAPIRCSLYVTAVVRGRLSHRADSDRRHTPYALDAAQEVTVSAVFKARAKRVTHSIRLGTTSHCVRARPVRPPPRPGLLWLRGKTAG
jgi:hypothetical protein